MTSNNTVVAVMSFERPDFLQQCLDSLSRVWNVGDYDFKIFQDRAYNPHSDTELGDKVDVERCIEIAEQSDLPNKDIRISEHNLGTGLMRDKVLGLFDEGYDSVLQVEDDVIVGRGALRIMEVMTRQLPEHLANAYMQRDYSKINNPEDELDIIRVLGWNHLYTFGMSRQAYENIRDRWDAYVNIIEDVEYHNRDHQEITDEFPETNKSFSDAVLCSIFREMNNGVIRPNVSRARYIGQEAPEYGNEGPLTFEQDKNIEEFTVYGA